MITEPILAIGVMLITGFLGGTLANRLKFPRVTGYILVGMFFSPSMLNIIASDTVASLDILTFVALGIIAYSIGNSLKIKTIMKFRRSIAWITPFQSIGAWLLVTLLLVLLAL